MKYSLKMPEITEEELCAHIEEDDFFRRYGNPVVIRTKEAGPLICMAWKYYERIMGAVETMGGQDALDLSGSTSPVENDASSRGDAHAL